MAAAIVVIAFIGFIIILYGCIKINTSYDIIINDGEQEAYLKTINKD